MADDNLEDRLDSIDDALSGDDRAMPRAKCRLTAWGSAEEHEALEQSMKEDHPRIKMAAAEVRPDEQDKPYKTYSFQAFKIPVVPLSKLHPHMLILLSWGYPLPSVNRIRDREVPGHNPRSPSDTGAWHPVPKPHRGGRAILFRWDRHLLTEPCPLAMGDETRENFLYRVHLWGMEFIRTHHQWKQGIINAANIQMV